MKRKIWIISAVTMAMGSMVLAGTGNESNDDPKNNDLLVFTINETKSTFYWEGSKPGGTHYGSIRVKAGTAYANGENIEGGTFMIDMTSIQNEDLGNEGMRDKLVGHLKSEDFFYVEKYPEAQFEITGSESIGEQKSMITGNLTIRGNTHEISFPAEVTMDDQMIHARSGEISLDRTRWEVNHMSKSVFADMKDRFIDDQMIVKLDIHFNRQ